VRFKILLLAFKALHGLAPEYLAALLQHYTPGRPLRSGAQNLLVIPNYKLKTFGGRSFACVAPRLWNDLPHELRSADCLSSFKVGLKTFLFRDAYKL